MAIALGRRISKRIIGIPYINRWFVFAFDLIVSGIGTGGAYLLACSIFNTDLGKRILFEIVLISLLASTVGFLLFKTYKNIIRHTSFQSIWRIAAALLTKTVLTTLAVCFIVAEISPRETGMAVAADFMFSFCTLVISRLAVVLFYQLTLNEFTKSRQKVLIYGVNANDIALSNIMNLNAQSKYVIGGYLKFSKRGDTYSIGNLPVYVIRKTTDLMRIIEKEYIEGILFTHQSDIWAERNRLIAYCMEQKLKLFTIPPIGKWKSSVPQVRNLNISDLLGRDEIRINTEKIAQDLKDKTVLVTGAAGSIGSELCRQIASFQVGKLVLFDNCETGIHNLRLELEETVPGLELVPMVGDVRSKERLQYLFNLHHPQIVFHAAAYKHVPLMELNPNEAFIVNVMGTMNIAHTALEFDAEKFVMVSTDKAVNPTNVMGASKRLAEIYVQSLDHAIKAGQVKGRTQYITTRFGNVLGSQGSVIPRFEAQIAKGGPVTVTHPEITRYFMTIKEACLLVLEASNIGNGGDIMVFDMGTPVKIADLAKKMIQLSGYTLDTIRIEYTGLRPGEKLYEEVLSSIEHTRPTSHKKIRIANARTYDFESLLPDYDELIRLATSYQSNAVVSKAKEIIPEYVSNNSVFTQLDHGRQASGARVQEERPEASSAA